MKLSFIVAFFVIALTNQATFPKNANIVNTTKDSEPHSIVINLKNELDSYIQNYDNVIALFHMDWCGHCRHFLPIFDNASSYAITNKFKFLKINCNHREICDPLGIDRFPTIKVYNKGKLLDVEPSRELVSLLEFIDKLSSNPLIPITNEYTKDNFYKDYGTFSPYVHYTNNNSEFVECLNNLSRNEFLSTFYFGMELVKETQDKVIFDFDGMQVVYNWNNNCESLKNFLIENEYPLINEIDGGVIKKLNKKPKMTCMLFYDKTKPKQIEFINNQYKQLSLKHRNIVFGYIEVNTDKTLVNYLKVKPSPNLQIIIYDFNIHEYYQHNKQYTVDNDNESMNVHNELQNMLSNINQLEFITGEFFPDLFKKLGLGFLNPYLKWIVLGLVILVLVLIIALIIICDKDELQPEEIQKKQQ
jgi:thiol-disulfide isomerase/thioredoxin